MVACIITGVICFIVGGVVGIGIIALMIVAGDDSDKYEFHQHKEDSDNGGH